MAILAGIDIGTNTLRLLVAEVEEDSVREIYSENKVVRLGEGFGEEKVILPAAMERALAALTGFKEILQRHSPEALAVVGTSAVREAKNQAAFLEEIKRRTGFEVRVITGEEEALFTFSGVNLVMQNKWEPMLVIDIGGGSSEFICSEGETPTSLLSVEMGVVHLSEKYLHSDPPAPEELKALRLAIDKIVKPIGYHFPPKGLLVGTAGTVTTLAAIDQRLSTYDPAKINKYSLSRASVERLFKELSSMTLEERRRIPTLEKGREDLIISGCLILWAVMDIFGYDPAYVSDTGLREGVLLDLYQRQSQ